MIAVAVAAITLVIAIPSYTGLVYSNRLSSAANEFVGAIREAQIEAIKHNQFVQFCGTANNSAGASDTFFGGYCDGLPGLVAYQDKGNNGSGVIVWQKPSLPTNVLLGDGTGGTTAVTALRFSGNGLATVPTGTAPYSGFVADIYTLKTTRNNHRCLYIVTGNTLSSCIVSGGAGACPTPNEPTNCQQ